MASLKTIILLQADLVKQYYALTWFIIYLVCFFHFFGQSPIFAIFLDGSQADTSVFIMYFECLLWVTHLMTVKKREQEWIQLRDHWILFYCLWTLSIRVNPMSRTPFWASRKLLHTSWVNRKPQNTGVGSLSLCQKIFPTQQLIFPTPALQADSLPAELQGEAKIIPYVLLWDHLLFVSL